MLLSLLATSFPVGRDSLFIHFGACGCFRNVSFSIRALDVGYPRKANRIEKVNSFSVPFVRVSCCNRCVARCFRQVRRTLVLFFNWKKCFERECPSQMNRIMIRWTSKYWTHAPLIWNTRQVAGTTTPIIFMNHESLLNLEPNRIKFTPSLG